MAKKRQSLLAGAVVAVVLVVAVIVLTTGTKRMTPLTPEMREGLGATAYVPEDVAVYTSSYRLADKWTRFLHSNALQSLVRTPYAQQLIMQVQMDPGFHGFMAQLSTNPDLVEVLPVLKDAVMTATRKSVTIARRHFFSISFLLSSLFKWSLPLIIISPYRTWTTNDSLYRL